MKYSDPSPSFLSSILARLFSGSSSPLSSKLIGIAFIIGCLSVISFLIYPSPYSPLVVAGTLPAAAILMALFRNPVWALYAAVFVVLLPLGIMPSNIHSLLNRSVTVVALVTWLFAVLLRQRRVLWPPSTVLMLGFLLWSGITLLWAENLVMGRTLFLGYALRFVVFLLLIPSVIRTHKELDGLMNTLALNGWVFMLVSVGTIVLSGYVPGTRLQVLEINPNELGTLALVTLTGILWQTVRPSKRQGLRNGTATIFILMTIGLTVMSGSRGSAISLLLTFLLFWFLRPTRRWGKLGLLVLLIGAMATPFIFKSTLDRFVSRQEEVFVDQWQESALGGRQILWQAGWQLIKDHPLSGVGIGNSSFAVMPKLLEMKGDWEQDEEMNYLIPDWASLHNPILIILSETGFPGLALYLGVLVGALWSFARTYLKHRRLSMQYLIPYFATVVSVFLGYMISWVKGGGMELGFTYFLLVSLLLIPSVVEIEGLERSDTHETVKEMKGWEPSR